MAQAARALKKSAVEMDLSDVKRRVGQEVGGGELFDPCSTIDIRRWVMALDYPNPIHWDHEFAQETKLGGIVAPQSFPVAMDIGHGAQPSCVGRIPGSALIFGGEEWWHYGTRLRPGDRLRQRRWFLDYKLTETNFAGPTLFQRGDTVHLNQHGTAVAKVRSTSIRYLAAEAERRGDLKVKAGAAPRWKREELIAIERERMGWIMSNREGVSPRFGDVKIGDKLRRRVIGPHTLASFASEYRAFIFNVWGTFKWVAPEGVDDPWVNQDAGWVDGFAFDYEGAKIDPRLRDGLYVGPSRGHVDVDRASQIGLPRAYGYGATMGAWVTDYIAYWAGHEGLVRYSNLSYRSPAYEGDVTYLNAEVKELHKESAWGAPLVQLEVTMTNQDNAKLASGRVDVELP